MYHAFTPRLSRRPSMMPLRYFLGRKEMDFTGREAVEVKYQNSIDIREFEWIAKVLPGGMSATVVTKQTRSSAGKVRAVPLVEWLREDTG